ncbi:hypothetical protein HYV84_01680 [Candidatus Woesearchaeota archaeon]|nr:hypothetical protein [Candidatus Woesearchaeota archaeon]
MYSKKMFLIGTRDRDSMEAKKAGVDLVTFTDNVDSWIKQIRSEVGQLTDVSTVVEENTGNIQHNYELIYELKHHVDKLGEEVKALKMLQLLQMKEQLARRA